MISDWKLAYSSKIFKVIYAPLVCQSIFKTQSNKSKFQVILHLLNGFEAICIIQSWFKELGFILCYGSIFLKLYKHLIEFRTRKAHRWIIKNFDLLKYLTVMFAIMCAYMLAFSTFVLHLKYDSDFTLLKLEATRLKQYFVVCKLTLWNFATIFCELVLLFFACRTCYFIRRAKIHENVFLFLYLCSLFRHNSVRDLNRLSLRSAKYLFFK